MCVCVQRYIHTCMHTYIYTHMDACMDAWMHACMHACIHTYIHTFSLSLSLSLSLTHTHTHTHTLKHTHMSYGTVRGLLTTVYLLKANYVGANVVQEAPIMAIHTSHVSLCAYLRERARRTSAHHQNKKPKCLCGLVASCAYLNGHTHPGVHTHTPTHLTTMTVCGY